MLHPNFTPFPVLETERLVLRELRKDDAQRMFEIRSNPEVMHFVPRPLAKDTAEMEDWISTLKGYAQRNESILWGITLRGEDVVHGMICIWNLQLQHDRAELGYLLDVLVQRQGYMSEAITAVIRYGFDRLKLHSLEAIIDPENTASTGLVEKLGFVKEAHFRENFFFNDAYKDSTHWSLLAPLS